MHDRNAHRAVDIVRGKSMISFVCSYTNERASQHHATDLGPLRQYVLLAELLGAEKVQVRHTSKIIAFSAGKDSVFAMDLVEECMEST